MIEALAIIFSGYAAYAAWPWWTATVVGALSGLQVATARMYRGVNKDRIAAADPAATGKLFQVSAIGIAAGAAIATAAYFIARTIFA